MEYPYSIMEYPGDKSSLMSSWEVHLLGRSTGVQQSLNNEARLRHKVQVGIKNKDSEGKQVQTWPWEGMWLDRVIG